MVPENFKLVFALSENLSNIKRETRRRAPRLFVFRKQDKKPTCTKKDTDTPTTMRKKCVLAFENDAQIYVSFTIRAIQKKPRQINQGIRLFCIRDIWRLLF